MGKKILICVGTRPNLIKVTRFEEVLKEYGFEYLLLHTGQHYDYQMSQVFFDELQLKKPDVFLGIKGETQSVVIANIITEMEKVIETHHPDLVLVPGDVNSSMACAITANRLGIPLGHIESGLRSFDRGMPEEINRKLIDELSDLFFVTEESGINNLKNEQKLNNNAFMVGNTMIDTLVKFTPNIDKETKLASLGLSPKGYALVTFHRPANVDNKESLQKIVELLQTLSKQKKVLFPIHPRTKSRLGSFDLFENIRNNKNIILTGPQSYFSCMGLVKIAQFVLTDSGGIQEETTFLKVPCLTIRPNTERPVTCEIGTNTLIDLNVELIIENISKIISGTYKQGKIPPLWDGFATERIVEKINDFMK
jgi:UDP-N-acetylglucosamine 2-epimerase (non-hydrolysing)